MKRKIVQHGSSSLTITLPIKWVGKFNLKKGDELDVIESGPMLMLSTEQEIASPKKEISVTESGIFTANNLSHLYQLGYDEIDIHFEDSRVLDEITKRIPGCIGFEIIDLKKNQVRIKSIAVAMESEFDTLLRKSFQITNEMANEMVDILNQGDFDKLHEIRAMESLNNKFTDVCIRIPNKKGYKVPKRTMQIYEVIKNIERIADEFKYICDIFLGNNKKIDRELLKSFKDAVEYYLAFYSMFYKFEPALKRKIYLDKRKLLKRYIAQLQKSKGINSQFVHHMINIIQKTYEGTGAYLALIL